MLIKYLGHSCFYLEWSGRRFIVDPFISGNPLASEINMDEISVDYILVTHGHQDHVHDLERISKNNPNAIVISNFEIVSYYQNKGIKGHPLNHGGSRSFDFGVVKLVNAIHSSVLPDGTYGGNPGGFVLWNEERCFYIAGDTALTYDMKLIPKLCPSLDFAILPIGDNFTMGHEEAIVACEFIQCKKIIACHFDTFDPIAIDHQKVMSGFESQDIHLKIPKIGESIEI